MDRQMDEPFLGNLPRGCELSEANDATSTLTWLFKQLIEIVCNMLLKLTANQPDYYIILVKVVDSSLCKLTFPGFNANIVLALVYYCILCFS